MSPTEVTTRPARSRPRSPIIALVVGAAVLAIAVIAVARVATRTPSVVERVAIDNATPYGVDVTLRESESASRVLLGRALPERETTWQEVLDSGDRWIFSFARSGIVAEIEVSRAQLERNDWRVAIPETVVQRLQDAGLRPYPEEGSR